MEHNKINIKLFGTIALLGAIGGIFADLFSAWSTTSNAMNTAISIDIESIKGLFSEKPRWEFVLGNYLGIFFIPLHMFGFFMVYLALKPAGNIKALLFLIASFYLIALGTGFHGTLAFIGDTIQSGNDELLIKMIAYWQVWGAVMIAGYLTISFILFVMIVTGQTMYARKAALLSPFSVMILSTILIAVLPREFTGVKNFFSVTGLNLPLLIFYLVTLMTFSGKPSIKSESI